MEWDTLHANVDPVSLRNDSQTLVLAHGTNPSKSWTVLGRFQLLVSQPRGRSNRKQLLGIPFSLIEGGAHLTAGVTVCVDICVCVCFVHNYLRKLEF